MECKHKNQKKSTNKYGIYEYCADCNKVLDVENRGTWMRVVEKMNIVPLKDVVEHWIHGEKAISYSRTLWTDGRNLYSYRLRIGKTTINGKKIVYNYTRAGEFVSQTTSRHVGLAKRALQVLYVTEGIDYEEVDPGQVNCPVRQDGA